MAEENTPEESRAHEKPTEPEDPYISLLPFMIVVAIGFSLTYGLANLHLAGSCLVVEWESYLLAGSFILLIVQALVIPKTNIYKKGIRGGLIVLLICGFFASVASGRNQYYHLGYESDAKSNLHNLYLGCKAYWAENGSDKECRVDIVSSPTYGYVQSSRVTIVSKGTESDFSATSQHACSRDDKQWSMDANGKIQ